MRSLRSSVGNSQYGEPPKRRVSSRAIISRSCQRMCAIPSCTDHSPQKPASCISSGATCPTNSSQCALDRLTCARNSDFVMGSTIQRAPPTSAEGWTQRQQVVQIGPPIGHFIHPLAIDGDLLFLQPLASQPLIEPAVG